MTKWILLLVLVVPIGNVRARQPTTVGEALEMGGRRLTKDEVSILYAKDVEVEGLNPRGTRRFVLTYRNDGSISGRSTDLNGNDGYGLFGAWRVSEEGRFCSKLTDTYGRDATVNPPCSWRFRMGDSLFSASFDEPNASLRELKWKAK